MARILIIETDPLLAGNICNYFHRRGHKVTWHAGPQAAVHSADKQQPDLVIMELLLAGHNGVEFLYEFRSYPEWQGVPVVLFSNVSAHQLAISTEVMKQLGIQAYHYKPTTKLSDLNQTLETILQLQPSIV